MSWAMAAAAIADLKEGPVTATDGEVTAVLSVNAPGGTGIDLRNEG
jgi:hypothetical protein